MAMASLLFFFFFFFFFFLFAASFGSSSAAVYTVGDNKGWTIMGSPNYTAWAEKKSFHVGDTLLFLYNNTFHNVVGVKKSDYDACTQKSAIATYTTGKDSITIKTAGTHYFLCGFPGHCAIGQKVAIAASAAKSVAPASSAAPSPSSGSGSGSASSPAPQGDVTPPSSGGSSSSGGASVPAPAPKTSNAAAVGLKGLGLVFFSLVIAAVSAGSLISA